VSSRGRHAVRERHDQCLPCTSICCASDMLDCVYMIEHATAILEQAVLLFMHTDADCCVSNAQTT
jgi:hypothetical protein